MPTTSPCIGYCQIDESSGLCLGCARTRSELAAWRDSPSALQEKIWSDLPKRRERLGIDLHRLNWTRAEIRSFILSTLRTAGGTWACGVYGAVAEFCVSPGEVVEIGGDETCVVAETSQGAIRFQLLDNLRVLSLPTRVGAANKELMVFAVPRKAIEPRSYSGLAELGLDKEAIRKRDCHHRLYDLAVGTGGIEFCVRTDDPELTEGFPAYLGRDWSTVLAGRGGKILKVSPPRVLRNPIGRIEVFAPIPLPGGRSPNGPHTHFLPAHLALKKETPPGLELPEALVACMIYYPEAGPADSCT